MKSPLPLSPVESSLAAPKRGDWQVQATDPARSAMTDFREHGMVTVVGSQQIDAALETMRHAGVRSAFVTDADKKFILGLITAYDIMGEKPLAFLQSGGGTRDEVVVVDIMEPISSWQVARFADVERATVSSVLDTFQKHGGTHLAVVEEEPGQGLRLRGIFSSAKLLRLTEKSRAAHGK
jgi:CBS domain-containing protein